MCLTCAKNNTTDVLSILYHLIDLEVQIVIAMNLESYFGFLPPREKSLVSLIWPNHLLLLYFL